MLEEQELQLKTRLKLRKCHHTFQFLVLNVQEVMSAVSMHAYFCF